PWRRGDVGIPGLRRGGFGIVRVCLLRSGEEVEVDGQPDRLLGSIVVVFERSWQEELEETSEPGRRRRMDQRRDHEGESDPATGTGRAEPKSP
ncbi:MAG: hypothetical protein AAF928_19040, partial [Myxococcota bacterium]